MSILVDAIILLFILTCGLVGFKEGVIKRLSTVVGLILVVVLAFHFKSRVSVYLYENLPFFNFWGVFKGVQSLNIIFYEMLAFVIIASVLLIFYNILLAITGLIEKVLKATVILSIPSKILGFIVGLIEGYIWSYIILFIVTLPFFNIPLIHESKTASYILQETPVLSKYAEGTVKISTDVYNIVVDGKGKTNEEINTEALDLMLKHKVITVSSAEKLIDKNRIEVSDKEFLEKYK